MSTAHAESFNNCLNTNQAKRIVVSDITYCTRSLFTDCHWNENGGREISNVYTTRLGKKQNQLQAGSHNYRNTLWIKFLYAESHPHYFLFFLME